VKYKLEVSGRARDESTWIFTLTGDLFGSKQGYAFQEDVREKIAGGVRKVVIDLAGVVRVDSSGIGILMGLMWSASQAGAGLVLASLSPTVERVLSVAMLLEHVERANGVDEALALLDGMDLGGAKA
jgi:anti-sigma B factor antagonist